MAVSAISANHIAHLLCCYHTSLVNRIGPGQRYCLGTGQIRQFPLENAAAHPAKNGIRPVYIHDFWLNTDFFRHLDDFPGSLPGLFIA